MRDAIAALVVRSANDAAVALAEALGKTEWNFALMMTQKARDLGMRIEGISWERAGSSRSGSSSPRNVQRKERITR